MLLKLLRANIQLLFKISYKERKVFKKSKRRLTRINEGCFFLISNCPQLVDIAILLPETSNGQKGTITFRKRQTDFWEQISCRNNLYFYLLPS